jgi:hypothetical protein
MITCNLIGPGVGNNGLGNQMFCIAATVSLAEYNNDIAVFPQIQQEGSLPYLDNLLSKLPTNNYDQSFIQYVYNEEDIHTFKPIPYTEGLVINGYWQSHKYFENNRDLILELFSPSQKHKDYIEAKYTFDNPTVSIHVRRGDYVNLPEHHPLCSLDYYDKSLNILKDKEYNYLVFSDDLEWCRLNFPSSYTFVDEEDYISLYMMSMCDHNIIANSTFSWWGAWLNTNEDKKVIYPKQWFGPMYSGSIADRIPEDWIQIEN